MTQPPDAATPAQLDPRARLFIGWLKLIGWPPLHERSVAQARRDYRTLAAAVSGWRPMASVHDARAHTADRTIPVRIYRPYARTTPAPLLVWFHGGGFTVGDLFTADGMCRRLAYAAGAVVVSVHYRLAPEHPLPAAHHDAVAAARWAMAHCAELGADPARVALGGDSAGACLATHTARVLRDEESRQAALQLLMYPATDLSLSHADWDPALAHVLEHETLHWFAHRSMPGMSPEERRNPDISPMFAEDLSGLPPAMLITAGVDPVRADGIAYAERLREAGVPVTHADYPGQIHGFAGMDLLFPAGARALDAAAHAIATVRPVPTAALVPAPEPIDRDSPTQVWQRRIAEATRRVPAVNAVPMLSSLIDHRVRGLVRAKGRRR